MDLVKVWRKLQPSDQHKGVRGGHKKSGRPQWIGPGRVIFQEVLPHQPEGDHRRHILWVLIGNRVMRCSVHSIRLCTEPERLHHDLTTDEDPTSWKTLADILPKREFTDMVDQAPSPEELELPDLPPEPDDSTLIPIRRAHSKQTYGPQDFRRIHRSSPLGVRPDPHRPHHFDRLKMRIMNLLAHLPHQIYLMMAMMIWIDNLESMTMSQHQSQDLLQPQTLRNPGWITTSNG